MAVTIPTTASQGPRTHIVLHDEGHVTLLIGGAAQQQYVKASRMVMSLASPVWKAMLSKRWAGGATSHIIFPDDDIDAMVLVLRIAHMKYEDIPGKHQISHNTILQLATVCDKYDLIKMIRPCLNTYQWALHFEPDIASQICRPSWLHVAWTFGYIDSFERLSMYMTRKIATISKIPPQKVGKFDLDIDSLPPQILDYKKREKQTVLLERILQVREDTLSAMLKASYDVLDLLLSGKVCKTPDAFVQASRPAKGCRYMILGSYIECLMQIKLYPNRPDASDLLLSIDDFQIQLSQVFVTTYPGPHIHSSLDNHNDCVNAVDLRARVARIITQMPSPVTEFHRNHMAIQAGIKKK